MKKILYISSYLFIFCNLSAFCQNDNSVINNAVAALKILSGDHAIEKVYLHFDRPYYAVGDTMRFKAYLTLGEHSTLSNLSGILHVDLITPGNTIIKSIKLQLVNGIGWGDFSLPFILSAGNYRVRAYTSYMQNAPDYFFDKTIAIGSIMNTATIASTTSVQSAKADLQFFPEGGELVSSMVSKVAFKSIGITGLGLNVKGVIVDNANAQVASFTSSHLGMGTFYLLPEDGKTYKAKVTFGDGTQGTFNLPGVVNKGIALAIKDTLGKLSIEIRSNKAYFQENLNKNISLVIYGGGFVNTVNTKLDSRRLSMDIANIQFPSGVVKVTLFSDTGDPLSERLVFVKNPDMVDLILTSKKTTYGKRERVSITVGAKDKGADVEGHFSVAVIDESKVPVDENSETTILTYLLLSSQLRGYIEEPNYYFLQNSDQTNADLDVLMLTQGYRRFTWKQLQSDRDAAFTYAPEQTLGISGIAKTASGLPVKDMDVMLLTTTKSNMLGDRTDNNGKFKFYNLPAMPDSTTLVLQATGSTKTRNTTTFTLDAEIPELPVAQKNEIGLPGDVNSTMVTYLKSSQAQQNMAFDIGAARPNNEKFADQVVTADEIGSGNSLIKALSGRLRNVKFEQGVPYLKTATGKNPMLIVVDGKIRGSYLDLDKLNPADVGKVEVLEGKNADSYGIYGNAGVLSITLRNTNADAGITENTSYKYNSRNVVKVKSTSFTESDKNNYASSNLGGAGHADQVIKGDQIKNSTSLSVGLSGLLHGINFLNGVPFNNISTVFVNGVPVKEPMYVVLDGSPLDPGQGGVDAINPLSVETVEVLNGVNAMIYGTNGGSGVLVITSRRNLPPGAGITGAALGSLAFHSRGFYVAREFYSPKYENNTADNKPDLRSTIFWAPELATNKDGYANFEFYNSDERGTYRVVIEGIDSNGNIGRQVYRYKVE